MTLTPQDQSAINDFANRVRHTLASNVVELKLFGSRANGDATDESDIDILVVVNTANLLTEDRVLDIAFEVNLRHEVYISPRVVARATLDDPMWHDTPFVRTLLRDAITL
jgi:predicted nucleotidyltransferase